MKVLLSQTVFGHISTHGGSYNNSYYGSLDTGGWPKTARDRALRIVRKAFAFHIAGDQHLPSLTQYGIDNYRDAGWCFVTPAIATGYPRWFRADEMNIPVSNRPSHGLPNTGNYKDAFGNLNYVYAVGNPGDFQRNTNRYEFAQSKSSGFGMIYFDTQKREITMESWRFLADAANPGSDDQFPGWPLTINQLENYEREATGWLPSLKINGDSDPVVEIINESTGETEYILRISGKEFTPKVFSHDVFTIRISYPEKDLWKEMDGIKVTDSVEGKFMEISF